MCIYNSLASTPLIFVKTDRPAEDKFKKVTPEVLPSTASEYLTFSRSGRKTKEKTSKIALTLRTSHSFKEDLGKLKTFRYHRLDTPWAHVALCTLHKSLRFTL